MARTTKETVYRPAPALRFAEAMSAESSSSIVQSDLHSPLLENNDDQSPIAQVAATVDTNDDPSLPVWTFRMWILGLTSCILLAFLNQFFQYRTEPLIISPISVQVLALPLGRLMAAYLPQRLFRIPWFGLSFSLNPGPFNKKEHVLISIFACAGSGFGHGGASAVNVINIIKVFYKRNIDFVAGLLIVLTSQVFGYGWAGLVRKNLVEPASMWWPGNMVQVSLFRTLHEKDHHKGLSRTQFFLIVMVISFSYYLLPGYLFMTLSSMSWVCWLWPKSVTAQQLGSGLHGLGLGSFSLDWASISAYILSPLVVPAFVTLNVLVGFSLFVYVVIPTAYFGNLYHAKSFPIFSSHLYARDGQVYDVSSLLTENFQLDLDAYNRKGPIYMSIFFVLTYGLGFATLAATLTHVACFHGSKIWQQSKASFVEKPDIHTRMMRKYPDIPQSWFFLLLIGTLVISFATCQIYIKQLQLPWWGMFLACLLSLMFVYPVGVITATTNQTPGLNVITEYILGYLLPGRPVANVCFKAYGYSSMNQAIAFLQDFKLGHYMKVPPRSMFIVQVIGTLVAGTMNMSVAWWLLNDVENICDTESLPPNSPWTCPTARVVFDASVVWGLIGTKRIFGPSGQYMLINWFFVGGAVAPICIWLLAKAFPKQTWIPLINMPVMLGATGLMPPATPVNFISWLIVGLFFNFYVYRRHNLWWKRYNYILSAALDVGLAFMGVLLYVSLGFEGKSLNWWGNRLDNCPLAACPIEPGIAVRGCPKF